MRWMHPVVLLNGNNRLTGQPVVLWLLIKPEMFMQVHAVNASGSKIWEKNVGNNLNYSGGALSTDGILYIGTQSNNKVLGLDITNGNIVFEETVGQQVMAAVSIGPDRRLYCGTIGSNNIGSIKAFAVNKTLATDSWSIRGGDIQGTNRQK